MTLREAAAAVGVEYAGRDVLWHGVSIDSRSVEEGQLFVALRGQNVDASEFCEAATKNGASALVTWRPVEGHVPNLVVSDPLEFLQELGKLARRLTSAREVIGITGSVGKTTTKDVLTAILGRQFVVASHLGNLNSHIGAPLALANHPMDVDVLIQEMGTRAFGDIAFLAEIVQPTVGVITRVAHAHTSEFGNLSGVSQAKAELVRAIPGDGLVVLNQSDPLVWSMRKVTSAQTLGFGTPDSACHVGRVDQSIEGMELVLESDWGSIECRVPLLGRHLLEPVLAAATTALGLGVKPDDVALGLTGVRLSERRMAMSILPSGAHLVDDSYNASPRSTEAALEAVVELCSLARIQSVARQGALPARSRPVAVLGEMAELGPETEALHRSIGDRATRLGVEIVQYRTDLYGTLVRGDTVSDVLRLIGPISDNDVILVKGSRSTGVSAVADELSQR